MNRLRSLRVFIDADNTVWDTDAIYARAQLRLLRNVANRSNRKSEMQDDELALAFVRAADQSIAREHPSGLRYPIEMLIDSVSASLGVNTYGEDSEVIVEQYTSDLRAIPELRAGAEEALPELAEAFGRLTVVTEGPSERCEELLSHYNLRGHIERVVSAKKSTSLYAELKPAQIMAAMIGDQLDRDIMMPIAAGFEIAIHFPSRFSPFWIESALSATHVITDFRSAVPLLRSVLPIV